MNMGSGGLARRSFSGRAKASYGQSAKSQTTRESHGARDAFEAREERFAQEQDARGAAMTAARNAGAGRAGHAGARRGPAPGTAGGKPASSGGGKPAGSGGGKPSAARAWTENLDVRTARSAIVLSEIIGPPVSKRRRKK